VTPYDIATASPDDHAGCASAPVLRLALPSNSADLNRGRKERNKTFLNRAEKKENRRFGNKIYQN
jgi:hypothetical protein